MHDKAAKRIFDQGTRRIHWLNAALMFAVFALAFSIDLATSRAAHTAMLQVHSAIPNETRLPARSSDPGLGLLQTNAHGSRVNLFFGELPAVIGKNRFLAEQLLIAHKAVGFSLLALIVLHVSAALYHHFVRRDDILTAMLPASAAWRTPSPRAGYSPLQGSLKDARGR